VSDDGGIGGVERESVKMGVFSNGVRLKICKMV
jgi:hypothetical protein